MRKRSSDEQTATVGISGSERRIYETDETAMSFDYDVFCRDVIKVAKRKLDACLLVPLKFYHDNKEISVDMDFDKLNIWLNDFSHNMDDFFYVWSYLTYENGGNLFEKWSKGNENRIDMGVNAIESAKGHLNDTSKLKDSKYIKMMCENRDMEEIWILNAYELTFKRIYRVPEIVFLIRNIIKYLNECGLDIQMPILTQTNEKIIYKMVACLMLLVIRVRLGISERLAMEWYKGGNLAYSLYTDQMLNEYINLLGDYYYNSYERFIMIQELAQKNKNKYAAKEIGDIYSLGGDLQDIYGHIIHIKRDLEMACNFYRISMEYEYIPAYMPAIKTNSFVEPAQRERKLKNALEEKSPLALAECAKENIKKADKCIQYDVEKASVLLANTISYISMMKDDYAEKYVIKNELMLSKSFGIVKENIGKYEQLVDCLEKGFSCDILSLTENEISKEIEQNYLLAGKLGYFEAEYKLGKYFQDKDESKSRHYISVGKEKGCNYCMLEYILHQENMDYNEWLSIMLFVGKRFHDDTDLLIKISKEWIRNELFFEKFVNDTSLISLNKVVEIYMQINNIITKIDARQEASQEKVKTENKLYTYVNKLKVIIKERIME